MLSDERGAERSAPSDEKVLESAILEVAYIPDFLLEETRFYFVPSRDEARAVYHELVGESADNWSSYYTRKGWDFVHSETPREGPYRVEPGATRIEVLPPGRFLTPRPRLRVSADAEPLPMPSLEKRRPLNPWKPTYIRAINFIKRYQWPHAVPPSVQAAIWEIEECGEIPGSTSWMNAERILLQNDSPEVRETLADVFYHRPEDFPLGSQVYLRVLGRLGSEGFRHLADLAKHPVTRKRLVVARTLGELRNEAGRESLFVLLEDEDPNVRSAALRSLGRVGVPSGGDATGKLAAYLDSPELSERVWAAQALLGSGDESHRKFLLQLVKEEPRPLADMGELGEVLAESDLLDAVPFLIQRLKDERPEISMDAAEVLEHLTGLGVEYSAQPDAEERRQAIKAYSRWWEEKKRERSAQRSKKGS